MCDEGIDGASYKTSNLIKTISLERYGAAIFDREIFFLLQLIEPEMYHRSERRCCNHAPIGMNRR